MDPLVMAGAWAGALLAIAGVGRILWKTFVKAVETVISTSIGRVWRDMDDIEKRLSALEVSMQFIKGQIEELRRMMQSHIQNEQ